MSDFNERIIAEFRANGGRVDNFGSSLVLLHTVGAKSGEPRTSPVLAIEDGGAWFVIASAAGSARHPAWYFNIVARPDLAIETPAGMVDVHAEELTGADYDAAWARFTARSPAFQQYQERAGDRKLPVFALRRR